MLIQYQSTNWYKILVIDIGIKNVLKLISKKKKNDRTIIKM